LICLLLPMKLSSTEKMLLRQPRLSLCWAGWLRSNQPAVFPNHQAAWQPPSTNPRG
jgi:hypothetical protein